MCSRTQWVAIVTVVFMITVCNVATAQPPSTAYEIGRSPIPEEISNWGTNISPNGNGLPAGGATAAEGRRVYQLWCTRCHGITGTEGPDDRLVGGRGALASESPRKTVGSYWPFATTLWDYVNRAMPFDQPGVLTPDEVYGSVAYVLFLNDIIGEQERMDASSVHAVRMPNRDGFVTDSRPDVH